MLNRKRVYNIYLKTHFVAFLVQGVKRKKIFRPGLIVCLFLAGMGLCFSYKDKSMPYNLFI